MIDVKLNKDELNVLLFALNSISLLEEEKFNQNGVSVSSLYNKIYSLWELSEVK